MPRILFNDDYRVIAVFESVVVLVAARPALPEHVQIVDRAVKEIAHTHAKGLSYIHVTDSIPGEPRRIPEETRKALVDLAKGAPPQTVCVSLTLLAEGFVAAAMRGVVMAAIAAFRMPVPFRVCSTIEESCFWVEGMYRKANAPCPPARDLNLAISKLRDDLPAHRNRNG